MQIIEEWTEFPKLSACLSCVVRYSMASVTGDAKPNIKILHASCEFVAIVAALICVKARVRAGSRFLPVACKMNALVRWPCKSITTATMALLPLQWAVFECNRVSIRG